MIGAVTIIVGLVIIVRATNPAKSANSQQAIKQWTPSAMAFTPEQLGFVVRVSRTGNGDSVGTGILVAPNAVLTCAHVVLSDWEWKKLKDKPSLADARISDASLTVEVQGRLIPVILAGTDAPKFHSDGEDLVLLTLEESVDAIAATFVTEFDEQTARLLENQRLDIYGYRKGAHSITPVEAKGVSISKEFVDPGKKGLLGFGLLDHVVKGYSGGPVVISDAKEPYCIGMATLGGEGRMAMVAIGSDRIEHAIIETPNRSTPLMANVMLLDSSQLVESRWKNIPKPPMPYIYNPYALLDSGRFVGRRSELSVLEQLSIADRPLNSPRVNCFVGMGGMGKSSLVWKWFNTTTHLGYVGYVWWSFYGSAPDFGLFLSRLLEYTDTYRANETDQLSAQEKCDALIVSLQRRPFLIALDGVERLLVAYRQIKSPSTDDATNILHVEQRSYLRRAELAEAASFFRQLTELQTSTVIMSSRLVPMELEEVDGKPRRGVRIVPIEGLSDGDALTLWRTFDVSGESNDLIRMFRRFNNFPLLVRALAARVASDKQAPGDFDLWKKNNPKFEQLQISATNVRSHVLAFALSGLTRRQQRLLEIISSFNMPVKYLTICSLATGKHKPFSSTEELRIAIQSIEDRGLIGFSRDENTFDMHPVVRASIISSLKPGRKRSLNKQVKSHLQESLWERDEEPATYEELVPHIELFKKLGELNQFDEAIHVFERNILTRLERLGRYRDVLELLGWLIEEHVEIADKFHFVRAISAYFTGDLEQLSKSTNVILDRLPEHGSDAVAPVQALAMLSNGRLMAAERCLLQGLDSYCRRDGVRECLPTALYLATLTEILIIRGGVSDAKRCLRLAVMLHGDQPRDVVVPERIFADLALVSKDAQTALDYASRGIRLSGNDRARLECVVARGKALLLLGRARESAEHFGSCVSEARSLGLTSLEMQSMIAFAVAQLTLGSDKSEALCLLNEVIERSQTQTFRLLQVDAQLALARVTYATDDRSRAIDLALSAFELAWCDGPPYAYAQGLEAANDLLRNMKASVPTLTPNNLTDTAFLSVGAPYGQYRERFECHSAELLLRKALELERTISEDNTQALEMAARIIAIYDFIQCFSVHGNSLTPLVARAYLNKMSFLRYLHWWDAAYAVGTEAEEQLGASTNQKKNNYIADARFEKATLLVAVDRPKKAVKLCSEVIALCDDGLGDQTRCGHAWALKGKLLFDLARNNEAFEAFDTGLKHLAGKTAALCIILRSMADCMLAEDRLSEATTTYHDIVVRCRDSDDSAQFRDALLYSIALAGDRAPQSQAFNEYAEQIAEDYVDQSGVVIHIVDDLINLMTEMSSRGHNLAALNACDATLAVLQTCELQDHSSFGIAYATKGRLLAERREIQKARSAIDVVLDTHLGDTDRENVKVIECLVGYSHSLLSKYGIDVLIEEIARISRGRTDRDAINDLVATLLTFATEELLDSRDQDMASFFEQVIRSFRDHSSSVVQQRVAIAARHKAEFLAETDKYDDALREFVSIIDTYSTSHDSQLREQVALAWLSKCAILQQRKQHVDAEKCYTSLIEYLRIRKEPLLLATACREWARAQASADRFRAASQTLQGGILADADEETANSQLAWAILENADYLALCGDFGAAHEEYSRAVDWDTSFETDNDREAFKKAAVLGLAETIILQDNNEVHGAYDMLSTMLTRVGMSLHLPTAVVRLAELEAVDDRFFNASELCRLLLEDHTEFIVTDKSFARAAVDMGDYLSELDRPAEANDAYLYAIKTFKHSINPDVMYQSIRAYAGLAQQLVVQRRVPEIMILVNELLESFGESLDDANRNSVAAHLVDLADVFSKSDLLQEAVSICETIKDRFDGSDVSELAITCNHANLSRANAHATLGQYDKALEAVDEFLNHPSTTQECEGLSQARMAKVDYLRLAERFEEALTVSDELLSVYRTDGAYLARGLVHLDAGRWEEAISDFNEILDYDDFPEVLVYRASAERLTEAYDASLASVAVALQKTPDSVGAITERCRVYHDMCNNENALDAACRLTAIDPDNVDGYSLKSSALGHLGRFQEAVDCLETAIGLGLTADYLLVDLAYWNVLLDRVAEAESNLNAASDPERDWDFYVRGLVEYKRGESRKAKASWDIAIRFARDKPVARQVRWRTKLNLLLFLVAVGDYDAAMNIAQEANAASEWRIKECLHDIDLLSRICSPSPRAAAIRNVLKKAIAGGTQSQHCAFM